MPGDGQPGTLGLWWSDFEAADNVAQLREKGITHRLNVAAEAVGKFRDEGFETAHVPMQDVFDLESCEDLLPIWKEQFAEVLRILREWREAGAVVNVSCQMGKNRSGCGVLLWLCAERGWKVEEAVEKLRGITSLACGNPHLIKAVLDFLQIQAEVPLNPAGDGGGWVCISPPGSPRAGGTQAFEDVAFKALGKLGKVADSQAAADERDAEEEPAEEAGDMEGLFEGL
uniref:Tyrosine specific protein phosphatases domain-containing protein n=1 Tax=Alexandrium catenella TaxID=2925 RepID=A0A7S1R880_ALECA